MQQANYLIRCINRVFIVENYGYSHLVIRFLQVCVTHYRE